MEAALEESRLERERAEREVQERQVELEVLQQNTNNSGMSLEENNKAIVQLAEEKEKMQEELHDRQELGGAIHDILREESEEAERKYALMQKMLNEEVESKNKECEQLREEIKKMKSLSRPRSPSVAAEAGADDFVELPPSTFNARDADAADAESENSLLNNSRGSRQRSPSAAAMGSPDSVGSPPVRGARSEVETLRIQLREAEAQSQRHRDENKRMEEAFQMYSDGCKTTTGQLQDTIAEQQKAIAELTSEQSDKIKRVADECERIAAQRSAKLEQDYKAAISERNAMETHLNKEIEFLRAQLANQSQSGPPADSSLDAFAVDWPSSEPDSVPLGAPLRSPSSAAAHRPPPAMERMPSALEGLDEIFGAAVIPAGQPEAPVDPESIAMLMSMGFGKQQCEEALRNTGGDVQRATEWIFNQ